MSTTKKTPDAEAKPLTSDPDGPTVTPPDLDAPTASAPPEAFDPSTLDESKPVTMADVAALNGIQVAPDASVPDATEKPPFISAGMQSDLDQVGWAIDPNTGRKIVKE